MSLQRGSLKVRGCGWRATRAGAKLQREATRRVAWTIVRRYNEGRTADRETGSRACECEIVKCTECV